MVIEVFDLKSQQKRFFGLMEFSFLLPGSWNLCSSWIWAAVSPCSRSYVMTPNFDFWVTVPKNGISGGRKCNKTNCIPYEAASKKDHFDEKKPNDFPKE